MGRPREFDTDTALERAMQVFWRHGYEGTSLSDLTTAMGVNPPSLYAAFGNKESLFQKVLDRYQAGPLAYQDEALGESTARDVIERLLRTAAVMLGDPSHPRGCLLVQGALSCGPAGESVRQDISARRKAAETALRERLTRARREGDLPAGVDPARLALYVATVMQGMAVQAASGAHREQLEGVAAMALRDLQMSRPPVRRTPPRSEASAPAPPAVPDEAPPADPMPQAPAAFTPPSIPRLVDKPKERRPSALSAALRMAAAMMDEAEARQRKG